MTKYLVLVAVLACSSCQIGMTTEKCQRLCAPCSGTWDPTAGTGHDKCECKRCELPPVPPELPK